MSPSNLIRGVGWHLYWRVHCLHSRLFGVATLRARVYSRWAALLLIAGSLVALTPPLGDYVPVVWLGFVLFAGRDYPAEQPAHDG
jgi:hypothetical protein